MAEHKGKGKGKQVVPAAAAGPAAAGGRVLDVDALLQQAPFITRITPCSYGIAQGARCLCLA